jgi:HPt (histidine-containing phosphotransfer) domain-containing protein
MEQPHLNRDLLAELSGGDEEFEIEVVGDLIDSAGPMLRVIEASAASSDSETLRRVSHSLKGAAASVGAEGLAEACSALEAATVEGLASIEPLIWGAQEELQLLVSIIEKRRAAIRRKAA